jgi:hypothetical protein
LNLKKLILPTSTAATITFFFPDLRAKNGFGLRTCGGGNIHGKKRWRYVCCAGGGASVVGGVGTSGLSGIGRLCRGNGGGCSGKTSNRAPNSPIEGIKVVRALIKIIASTRVKRENVNTADFTTTTEKSGGGGADFLKGVDGL